MEFEMKLLDERYGQVIKEIEAHFQKNTEQLMKKNSGLQQLLKDRNNEIENLQSHKNELLMRLYDVNLFN